MRSLLIIYCACHLIAFIALKRGVFMAFRWYTLAAALQGCASLLPWNREVWWTTCWAYVEPYMVLFRAGVILELGYYATYRLFSDERRHLSLASIYCGSIGALLILTSLPQGLWLEQFIRLRSAMQVAMAMLLMTGIWYFWIRPKQGMADCVKRHAYLMAHYLSVKAAIGLIRLSDKNPLYWEINKAYLVAISLLMLFWAVLLRSTPTLPRAVEASAYPGAARHSES